MTIPYVVMVLTVGFGCSCQPRVFFSLLAIIPGKDQFRLNGLLVCALGDEIVAKLIRFNFKISIQFTHRFERYCLLAVGVGPVVWAHHVS